MVRKLRQAIDGGYATTLCLVNYRKDGTPFWNNIYISPLYDKQRRVKHFIGVQCDVTAAYVPRPSVGEEQEQQLQQPLVSAAAGEEAETSSTATATTACSASSGTDEGDHSVTAADLLLSKARGPGPMPLEARARGRRPHNNKGNLVRLDTQIPVAWKA